jgi:hypothetical protein
VLDKVEDMFVGQFSKRIDDELCAGQVASRDWSDETGIALDACSSCTRRG